MANRRKKRSTKQKESKQSSRAKPSPVDAPPPSAQAAKDVDRPSPVAAEQGMAQLFGSDHGGGGGGGGGEASAQDLAYQAMEAAHAGRAERAIELAHNAVERDPGCVDALMLLAQAGSASRRELIENMRRTVEVAERELGEDAFEELAGHFWGFHETRPYRRARAFLAELPATSGRGDEAVTHYRGCSS